MLDKNSEGGPKFGQKGEVKPNEGVVTPKEDYLMTVSLRNFVFVLMSFTLVLLFPNRAAAEDSCVGICQDLWDSQASCGPCGWWATHWCFIGCACSSYCYTAYGECHCWKDNQYYKYTDHGLVLGQGSCSESDCGTRRIHVRQSPQAQARPVSQLASIALKEHASPGENPTPGSLLPFPEELMYVPSRCAHTYRAFAPRNPSRQPAGGM